MAKRRRTPKAFSIDVEGAPELARTLATMEPRVAKKLTRKAMREASKLVKDDAKRRVPVDSGKLKRAIVVRALKRSRSRFGTQVQTKDGFFKGDSFYGGFIELGTKKMPARPYLRPALYDNEAKVRQKFVESLREFIREEGKRAATRAA